MLEFVALATDNPFAAAAAPIINLINMAVGPLLLIVVALGTLYCVFLGVKLAKAEEPQDREKAKGALKNAIIGFVLIFVLIAAMNLMMAPLTKWIETSGSGVKIDTSLPNSGN